MPQAAPTLYLDIDASGLGWFIDPTPWDNTEYSQTLTETAYRATADSLAYGHSKTVRIWIWLKPMFSFSVRHIFVATGFGIASP